MGISNILSSLIQVYIYIILAYVIMSWLLQFNIISLRTKLWSQVWDALRMLTEPIFSPLRQMLPSMSGVDFTPLIVLVALNFLQRMI